jgi:hypothetical protein
VSNAEDGMQNDILRTTVNIVVRVHCIQKMKVRPKDRGKDGKECPCSENFKFLFYSVIFSLRSRDSVVGIPTSYGLDDRGVGVPVPVG